VGKHFPNPDHMRWELHRMWVVDATLRQASVIKRRRGRYYCDEDTWLCVLADRWDANGQLWRTLWSATFVAPDFPGTIGGAFGFNRPDLRPRDSSATSIPEKSSALREQAPLSGQSVHADCDGREGAR